MSRIHFFFFILLLCTRSKCIVCLMKRYCKISSFRDAKNAHCYRPLLTIKSCTVLSHKFDIDSIQRYCNLVWSQYLFLLSQMFDQLEQNCLKLSGLTIEHYILFLFSIFNDDDVLFAKYFNSRDTDIAYQQRLNVTG